MSCSYYSIFFVNSKRYTIVTLISDPLWEYRSLLIRFHLLVSIWLYVINSNWQAEWKPRQFIFLCRNAWYLFHGLDHTPCRHHGTSAVVSYDITCYLSIVIKAPQSQLVDLNKHDSSLMYSDTFQLGLKGWFSKVPRAIKQINKWAALICIVRGKCARSQCFINSVETTKVPFSSMRQSCVNRIEVPHLSIYKNGQSSHFTSFSTTSPML